MNSVKKYKLRVSTVVALAVLLLSVAAVSISAYEPCRQAVTRVITTVVPPGPPGHYSKATVARWIKWGKEHPEYHPPKRQPVVTTKEVQDMVQFACGLPSLESDDVQDLLTDDTVPMTFGIDGPRPYLVALATTTPPVALLNVPVQPAVTDIGDAPEPQSWVFGMTGVCFLALVAWKRGLLGGENELGTHVPSLSAL